MRKNKITSLYALFFLGFVFLFCSKAFTQEIEVTGSWSITIDQSQLQGGAGSDLPTSFESAMDQIEVEIKGKKLKDWRVDISKADGPGWPSGIQLWIRRRGDGVGSGTISGGTSYLEVTSSTREFFRGGKNRSKVPVQLSLMNVYCSFLNLGTYFTTVYYTVTGI